MCCYPEHLLIGTHFLYLRDSLVQVETELKGAGLNAEAISGIMAAMQVRSLSDLEILLGSDDIAVQQLQRLFELAGGYGFDDWLVFDASIVRGLAYYTGGPTTQLTTTLLSGCSHATHTFSLCLHQNSCCKASNASTAVYKNRRTAVIHTCTLAPASSVCCAPAYSMIQCNNHSCR